MEILNKHQANNKILFSRGDRREPKRIRKALLKIKILTSLRTLRSPQEISFDSNVIPNT